MADGGEQDSGVMALTGVARWIAEVRLAWALLVDARVPALIKLAIPIAVLYLLSPWDVIPDYTPLLGRLDDLGVLLVAYGMVRAFTPAKVLQEHQERLGLRIPPPRRRAEDPSVVEGSYRVLDE